MPRRSKLSLEALRSVGNEECPHCHAILSPAEYLRLDSERLRRVKCGKDFIPTKERRPADADELERPGRFKERRHAGGSGVGRKSMPAFASDHLTFPS
jgi:hypothetical protein